MKTSTTISASEDAICPAYGRGGKDLLSESSASEWIEDLWIIYSDRMAFQKEAGCNLRIGEIFLSFRELVFSFRSWRWEKWSREERDGLLCCRAATCL